MSRTRRVAVRAGLVLGSVALTLGAAELVFRTVMPASTHHLMYRVSDDPDLRVELVPGADFEFEGVTVPIAPTRVTVSSLGLRERELGIPKPAGTRRLLCVGDSTTFGWGVEIEESFCRRLEGLLPAGWQTVNLGVPGYNSTQEVRRLETVGLRLDPDLVVLLYDGNDVEPPIEYGGQDWLTWLTDRSALARWVRRQLIVHEHDEDPGGGHDEGRQEGGAPEPEWDGEAESLEAFRRLDTLRHTHGFDLLVLMPGPDEGQAIYDLLRRQNVPHASIRPALEGGGALEIPNDGHPNAEGHRRIAHHIARLLQERGFIAAARGPGPPR